MITLRLTERSIMMIPSSTHTTKKANTHQIQDYIASYCVKNPSLSEIGKGDFSLLRICKEILSTYLYFNLRNRKKNHVVCPCLAQQLPD